MSEALRRWLEQWLGLDPAYEAEMERLARPPAAYVLDAVDHPRFTHQLSFDDVVSQRQDRRIARLVHRLAAESGIEEAVHEDREVILLRSPLSTAEVEATVDRSWKRRGA